MEVFLLRRLQHVRGVIRLVEYIADAPGLADSLVIVTERIPDSCDLYDYVSRRCATPLTSTLTLRPLAT